ncbi:VCBS domain-containing protein, partial [Pararhizobium sp. YC-54]|uniref:VCBS domain-containing protein n=1 Tax=Pararhizobium sp. YC-54 TaxID=2986920 RepID=UPI0021F6DC8B
MATERADFSSDVDAGAEESVELRAAPDGNAEQILAQAENAGSAEPQFLDPATGKPVSNAQAAAPASIAPEIVTADASNVVRLPAGVSVEKIQVLGANIVLEQPDGSKITILNAALKIPTFVIGDAEIPKETLIAVLEGNGINVAAGPDGTISVASNQSGGGNFSDAGGNIGDAGPAIGLLAPTELQFGALSGEERTLALLDPNDAPLLVADQAGSLTEDVGVVGGSLTISGAIDVSDADVDDTLTVSVTPSGQPVWNGGALTQLQIDTLTNGFVATNTEWTYQIPNALVQFLNQGETIILSYQVTVTDDDGATATETVTITINGTNDAPVIGAASEISGSVTETGLAADDATPVTGPLTATGTMVSSDVDNNHTATWSGNAAGTYGSFVITAAGVWTYSLTDASVNNLAEGETRTETFVVTVTDDKGATDTETVTITINGTNDAPVIGAASEISGSVTETGLAADDATPVTGPLTATGTMVSSDVDNNHTATWSGNAAGTYGSFAITAAGVWTYSLTDASVNNLAEGETRTETFVVTVTDDNGATDTETVTITINGTNDAPVIGATSEISGTVTETGLAANDETPVTGPLSATGTMVSSDVDNNHTATWSGNAAGTYGSFVITAAGVWTYSLTDASVNNLAEGETRTETFVVTVTDDNGATDTETVTITINGTNDAPVITSGPGTGSVSEIADGALGEATAPLTATGALTFGDVDLSNTHTVGAVLTS